MQPRERKDTIRTIKGFVFSLLLHLLVLLLFWVSTQKIFFSKPAKQEKRITLDLSHFVPPPPPPKPKVKPVPPPQPIVPPRPKPKPKPRPEPKKVAEKKPEPVKKVLEEKKIFTAKKDVQENNVTKSAEKASAKVVKKEEPKKPKKKIVKKEKKKPKKRVVKKKVKKIEKKPKKKIVKKAPPKKPKKRVVQRRPQQKKYSSPLASSLMGSSHTGSRPAQMRRLSSASTQRMINKLYGSEYNGYSPEQKKFIKNNLGIIHQITQMTLIRNGYPEVAARTGQQGVNIVSFYLHPNGNITGLHLDKPMGYEALDRNTLQVIRIAYKDYPLPTKKTKIKFFVQYSIDGY